MNSPQREQIEGWRQPEPTPRSLARSGRFLCAYAVLISLLLMLLLIVSAQWTAYRGNFLIKKEEWRTVQGRITHSDIVRKHRNYRPDVRYVYSVEGQSFSGHNISFGYQGFPRESDALQIISKYKVGQNVPVYCLKQEPTFSVLSPYSTEPGSLAAAKGVLISIPLVLAGLIFTIFLDIRRRRRAGI